MTTMTREITSNDDTIDSRDVIARIEELGEMIREGVDDTDDDRAKLAALTALADQGENIDDWQYGATLIRESYFVTYAQELAEDIGAIDHNAGWPLRHIDWEAAADELEMDYTSVEFDGVTYWVR